MGAHHGAGGAEVSDTPETDGEWNRIACYDHPQFEQGIAEFARKLERERDEARFDLAFRRDLCALQQKQLDEVCLERNEWKEVAEGSLLGAIHERDEAVRSCHIWQDGYRALLDERDLWKAEAERWRDCQKDD
jgi:hypothetical protein